MKLTLSGDLKNLRSFKNLAGRLSDEKWKREAHRGVVDAARKTKTATQRAVYKQSGFKAGTYQANVVAHTRLSTDEGSLSARIFAVRGGQPIDEYRGLRVLSRGNKPMTTGLVKSGVWNAPRVFKRSFGAERQSIYFGRGGSGYFALLPGTGNSVLPPELWSFGAKDQPRDARGRFIKGEGQGYGRKRELYGPSLRKELVKGESLAVFHRIAPVEMEEKVKRRVQKLMRF
ncbi:MAG: hypothetical protein VYD57_13460 [Pseudomonadota bacterium]|nr:hypothetical protein [Pseudomonadota bacterium]